MGILYTIGSRDCDDYPAWREPTAFTHSDSRSARGTKQATTTGMATYERADNSSSPLVGYRTAAKDNTETAGPPCAPGTPALPEYVAKRDGSAGSPGREFIALSQSAPS